MTNPSIAVKCATHTVYTYCRKGAGSRLPRFQQPTSHESFPGIGGFKGEMMWLYRLTLGAALGLDGIIAAIAAPVCPDTPTMHSEASALEWSIDVGHAWSGTKVEFAATSDAGHVFVGYFDADRNLRLVDIDTATGQSRTVALPSRFGGWDSHNDIKIAVDKNGMLHVAGNMHATKLQYFMVNPKDLLAKSVSMTGKDEDHVTYPTFLHATNGDLLFMYRAGVSSNGTWIANAWDGRHWTRASDKPIFGATGFGSSVSAYPSEFARGSDGFFHVAIAWRAGNDAGDNVELSYAKTRDFREWVGSTGQRLPAPLTPETAERVLHTGPNGGMQGPQIAVSPNGKPLISFTGYNTAGNNTINVATPKDGSGWAIRTVATSTQQFRIAGKGALVIPISAGAVEFRGSQATINFALPERARQVIAIDPTTLVPLGCPAAKSPDQALNFVDKPNGLDKPSLRVSPVLGRQGEKTDARIVWVVQQSRGDVAPKCPPQPDNVCSPPSSMLRLVLPSR